MKQIIIAVLAVVAIIGGAVVLGKDKEATGQLSNHVYGKVDSTVALVEYGDFECPACSGFFPIVEQVKEKYKDKISFQFKHLPLVNSHRNALASHRAAEAAGKQGKFWEMYSKLYTNQEEWNGPSQSDPVGVTTETAIKIFENYAQELGLNMDQFKSDVIAGSTVDTINADTAEAKNVYNATGTPSFILNDKKIEDISTLLTVDGFSKLIDEALGESSTTTSTDAQQAPAADSSQKQAQ